MGDLVGLQRCQSQVRAEAVHLREPGVFHYVAFSGCYIGSISASLSLFTVTAFLFSLFCRLRA